MKESRVRERSKKDSRILYKSLESSRRFWKTLEYLDNTSGSLKNSRGIESSRAGSNL